MPDTFLPSINPSVGSGAQVQPRILTSKFGDGYSQRVPDGLNFMDKELTLTWDALDLVQFSEILSFLESHAGYLSFYYTFPGENDANKGLFIAPKWSYQPREGGTTYSLSTSLERVYDIA